MRSINAWINVLIAALIMVATLPGRTQGLGLITEPLLRDLDVGRVSYAHINLWATLLGAIVCLPAGRIFDRLGLRITTTLITALLSLVVWQMSSLAGGIAALFVLVLATRALGQSALSVASITVVGKAFDRGIGFAMGVYSVLLSIFFAIWRRAYGSAHLGRIQGAAQMLTVLASAIGPLLFAKSVELTGSYMPVLHALAPAVALLGIAALRVRLPLTPAPVEAAPDPVAVN